VVASTWWREAVYLLVLPRKGYCAVSVLVVRNERTEVEEQDLLRVRLSIVAAYDEQIGSDLGRSVRQARMPDFSVDQCPRQRFCNRQCQLLTSNVRRFRTCTSAKLAWPSLPPYTTMRSPTRLAE
jgi:hypothetical protein